jgi:hypothetical protein
MITLSNVAKESKTLLKWGGIIIGAILVIIIFYNIGISLKNTFFPTPAPPPTVSFGKIPAIEFPKQTEVEGIQYKIDTLSGSLPNFPDRAKVFSIEKQKANLLALENASEKMESIGFTNGPTPVSGSVYRWSDDSSIQRTISFDIFSSDLTLNSAYLQDQNILVGTDLPSQAQAIDNAKDFLSNLGILYPDLDDSKTQADLLSITQGTIIPATSFSNAQLIKVFFFQENVENLPIYYSVPNESNISVTISGGGEESGLVEAKVNHQTITNNSGTYPIKTASETLEDLKNGNAYIAAYGGNNKNISINDVSLGYYFQDTKQNYLMPVVVFKGNDNFVAYVSAVKDEWINK